jgi:hypothetical protein
MKTVHVVVEQPEHEQGRVVMVCEDRGDARWFADHDPNSDVDVVKAVYVLAGQRAGVDLQPVWTVSVVVEPGGDGLWYPGAEFSRSEQQWCTEDPPAESTVERSGRTASSKPDKWVVRGTGPTPHTARTAMKDQLAVLLRQLEDGTLDSPSEQLRRAGL